MLRNISSQKWRVYAYDATTGLAKTGDASNITAKIRKDHSSAASTNDTNPTEVDSTNEKGYYEFDLTQAETSAYVAMLAPQSSTSNIVVIACPPVVYTRPQYFSQQLVDSNGRVDVGAIAGTTQTARDLGKERRRGGRIWYVSTSGNDSNAGTLDAPLLTPGAAITAATSGDTVRCLGGTFTMTSSLSTTKPLHWIGNGASGSAKTVFTNGTADTTFAPGSWSTIEGIEIINTINAGKAIVLTNRFGVHIENCVVTSTANSSSIAIYAEGVGGHFRILSNRIKGSTISIGLACQTSDADELACSEIAYNRIEATNTGLGALYFDEFSNSHTHHNDFYALNATAVSFETCCIFLDSHNGGWGTHTFESNSYSVVISHASATGAAAAIGTGTTVSGPTTPGVALPPHNIAVNGGSVRITNAGSGTNYSLKLQGNATAKVRGLTLAGSYGFTGNCQFVDVNLSDTLADTNEIQGKLPSKSKLAGSNNSDGDVEMNEATGNFGGSVASVAGAVGSVTGAVGSVTSAVTVGTINAGVITATAIADGAMSAAKFAAGALDSVWSVGSRLLTAGTNIVLAKGTGVTGFNDLSAATVNAEVDTALADYDAPTNAEMTARTLAAASYATSSALATAQSSLTAIVDDVSSDLPDQINAVSEAVAVVADQTNQLVFADGKVNANAEAVLTEGNIEDIADAVSDQVGGGGGSSTRPVNQVPVPIARTWVLKPVEGEGLIGEVPLTITTSDTGKLYAVDYRNDLANNGRLLRIVSVELISGSEDGIALGDDVEDAEFYGVDRSQAKFKITPITAGKYVFGVTAEYDSADGGGESYGEVALIVA